MKKRKTATKKETWVVVCDGPIREFYSKSKKGWNVFTPVLKDAIKFSKLADADKVVEECEGLNNARSVTYRKAQELDQQNFNKFPIHSTHTFRAAAKEKAKERQLVEEREKLKKEAFDSGFKRGVRITAQWQKEEAEKKLKEFSEEAIRCTCGPGTQGLPGYCPIHSAGLMH